MTFRPPLRRCYISFWIRWLFGTLIGLLLLVIIRNVPISDFVQPPFIFIMGMWLLGSLKGVPRSQEHLSITLSDEHVSGPNGARWRWGRVDLPLDKLDRERTCRETMLQRFLGSRYLWSTDGQKVRISYWEFTPAQVAALLEELGCNAAER